MAGMITDPQGKTEWKPLTPKMMKQTIQAKPTAKTELSPVGFLTTGFIQVTAGEFNIFRFRMKKHFNAMIDDSIQR